MPTLNANTYSYRYTGLALVQLRWSKLSFFSLFPCMCMCNFFVRPYTCTGIQYCQYIHRYRYPLNSSFLETRSFDAYIFGWSDNYTGVNGVGRTCLPTECAQADTYLLFGTCWNEPSGLPWEGTPLLSFIIFTAFIMRPITGLVIAVYEMVVKCTTKIENWPTLISYNKHFLTRRFTSLWINSYWFNMTLIFIVTRFGPAINQYRYQRCRSVAQDFSNGTCELESPSHAFEVVPYDYHADTGSNVTNAFLDLLLLVPGTESASSSPGVWNPENPLVAGLWIGCLFDLILTQSTYIMMVLSWPAFIAATCAKCCRSEEDRSYKCCRCAKDPDRDDAECETVAARADRVRAPSKDLSRFSLRHALGKLGSKSKSKSKSKSNGGSNNKFQVPRTQSLGGKKLSATSLGIELTEMSSALPERSRSLDVEFGRSNSNSNSYSRSSSRSSSTRSMGGRDLSLEPVPATADASDFPSVDHLRKYTPAELRRLHSMADFTALAGVLDYPRMILLTMVVVVFTIFFPFLVIFVTGGVLLEMQANFLGLMGFSRMAIPEASGDGRWTWMILWTQRAAIPLVVSYFVFTVLEFMACRDVEVSKNKT